MGSEELNDKISVLAKFEGGKLLPVLMRWRGRRYWIQKLNLHHRQPKGGDTLHFFAVSTEAGDCTLSYSQKDLSWRLVEMSFVGA